jgi:hypothetical protein
MVIVGEQIWNLPIQIGGWMSNAKNYYYISQKIMFLKSSLSLKLIIIEF